jgi:5-methylthioadenosine/S-adenosylhomocysteine deaminase
MSIFRGLGNDMSLDGWLNHFIWPAEKRFISPETVYVGSMVSMIEMIRSGTGTFSDMYFFEEEVARAASEIGMRVILGEGLLDFPTPSHSDAFSALRHTRRLHGVFKDHPLVGVSVAVHAPYTCAPDVIRQAAGLARELGISSNIHLAETSNEVELMRSKYGKSPVRYLADLGFLGPQTVAHHGIYLDKDDLEILAASGTTVASIPNSNMKLGSGSLRLSLLKEAGINVSIGTDGPASNNHQSMIREIQQVGRVQKVTHKDPTVINPAQLLRMATLNGARGYGLDRHLGSLEPGKLADLAIIDPGGPHWYPPYDPYNTMAYAMQSGDVETVLINGRVVLENRVLLHIDEREILHRFRKITGRIRDEIHVS